MCNPEIIRAWKDEDYRMSLSEAERKSVPANPAGLIEISDRDLGAVAGGEGLGGGEGMSFPGVCSCFGGCGSELFQMCSGDIFSCPLILIGL